MNNKQKNLLNYKIVKCKNWEKDKTCKYGAHCTFAHGDAELRNKTDNLYSINPSMGMMFPPFMMDMNTLMQMNPQFQGVDMNQIAMPNQMMMGMGIPINNAQQNIQPQANEQQNGNIPVEKEE